MRTYLWAACLGCLIAAPASAAPYDVAEKDIATLQADMTAGRVTALDLVQAYEARIAQIDPMLHSVIALNPDAENQARVLDQERRAGHVRGPLHGIPILVKDNIETLDPLATTAGSLALKDNITHRDAPVIARLRAAGVIVLGKTNLSEWANIRSTHSISGWSAIGGLTRNPYALDRNTCGSSAGSGAAVAASLAAAALGTETNGSLVCPGSFNGIVSLKPTVGLVSRTHIVPISHTQDTAGPMARSVADAALLLSAMAGSDPADAATADADAHRADYAASLRSASLKGVRLGLILPPPDHSPSPTDIVLQHAVDLLQAQGAVIVEIHDFIRPAQASDEEGTVLKYELKHDMAQYLQSLPQFPSGAGPKTLA
ncbi:MAG TPA: amidase family protein, partial [Rhizomicrobium sp.]|nr:amidase family protein [Rhizomicrobium sp.]